MASEDMERWLSLQPPNVKRSLVPRPYDEAGPMYHMSMDGNIKKFIPYVTRRTGAKENISVPRVSVAPSILGCFIGYCAAWDDILYPDLKNKSFKNGWYVYEIPYTECIRPATKVLYDVEETDEHWLVTFDEGSRVYQGEIIAKMFYSEMVLKPIQGKRPRRFVKLLVEVNKDSMLFGEELWLTKGHWEVEGPEPMFVDDWTSSHEYTAKKISAAEFMSAKKYTADMLSAPTSFRW